MASTLYVNGLGQIAQIKKDLQAWMDSKGYKKLADFRGKLSQKDVGDPFAFERAQYVDLLMKQKA